MLGSTVAATVVPVVWSVSIADGYGVWSPPVLTAVVSLALLTAALIQISQFPGREDGRIGNHHLATGSVLEAVITTDREHRVLFANGEAEKLFGYNTGDLLNRSLLSLIPECMRVTYTSRVKSYIEASEPTPQRQNIELVAIHKNGHEFPIELALGEVKPETQRGVSVVIRDITERRKNRQALESSEARYRMLFDSNPSPVLVFDLETFKVLAVNEAARRHYGYSNEEFLARTVNDIRPSEDIAGFLNQMAAVTTGEERFFYCVRHKKKDGTIFDAEINAHHVTIEGRAARLVLINDVTQRKRTELESRVISEIIEATTTTSNLEELLASIQQTIGQAVYAENFYVALHDAATDALQVPFCVDKFDVSAPPQKLGRGLTAYAIRQGRPTLLTRTDIDRLCLEGEVEAVGTSCAAWLGVPLRTPEGVIGVLVVQHYEDTNVYTERDIELLSSAASQITLAIERKRSEEALRRSEEKHRTILETIEEGYYELSLDGSFTFVNEAMCGLFRYTRDELIGLNYKVYVDAYTAADLFRAYNEVYRTGEPVSNLEFEIIRKDGERMPSETSIALLYDSAGEPIGFRGVVRDVTKRKKAEREMLESASQLAAAQRITHLGSWEIDLVDPDQLEPGNIRWSDETYRIFGYEPGSVEVTPELFLSRVHPDDRQRVADAVTRAVKDRSPFRLEHRAILPDGSERILLGQAEMVSDEDTPAPTKLFGTIQDITERRRTDAALRESEYKLRTLVTSMNEGLTQVGVDEVIEFVNDRLCELTGYRKEEMLGRRTLDLLFDDEGRRLVNAANKDRLKGISGQYEARIRKKSGDLMWVLVSGAPIMNDAGELTGTLGMFMDISERKRIEEQLVHDAFHDALTGLANRALFMDHLQMAIERGRSRHSNHYAVLFLDFDRFKVINDSLGHAEGDELLRQIARRLNALTRTGDLLARLGGDEFVFLLTEMAESNDAKQVAERIQEDLKEPFDLGSNKVFISASIGIALSTDGQRAADEMLRDADIAMYRAKANGKARYQVFNEAMRAMATTRLQLETEMRRGIDRGEFEIHYQPILDLKTLELSGFEALVRWPHPTRGLIAPNEFIPTAEENGLILPLGRWILAESCRQMRHWQTLYPAASSLAVNVNLSAKQFLQTDLATEVSQTLAETGLAAHNLRLEITESYLIENSEKAVKIMNRLRDLGIELSLDDFGTGYSSLSYLHSLPISSLKIDRSFIGRMTESGEILQIVRTIIEMAHNLKMTVIAEGIETTKQLEELTRLKCGYGQGYYFSRPMVAERAADFINANAVRPPSGAPQPSFSPR